MLSDLTVYVPTNRPVAAQYTLRNLPRSVIEECVVVVVPPNLEEGFDLLGYRTQVTNETGVENIRQEILDHHPGQYMMFLDDDLKFAQRRDDDPSRFDACLPGDERLSALFEEVLSLLQGTSPLVGVSHRSGANRNIEPLRWNTRMYAAWGFDAEEARERGFRIDRIPLMEDFDFHLQFLTGGYQSVSVNTFVQDNAAKANAAGGCSEYRTPELQEYCAKKMQDLWPGIVKAVEKTPKQGWRGMETRWDVIVQWKKAAG